MRKILIVALLLGIFTSVVHGAELDYVGVGAGPMGMGKTGMALSSDFNALFLNPAGLSSVRNIQITTMYTKLLEEVSYMVAGGTYPLQYGTLGISYTGTQVSDILTATTYSDGSLDPTSISMVNYGSSIMALSYGLDTKIASLPLSSGISLKFYGEDLAKGSASGYDADLGLRYQPFSWLRLGLVQKDFLPASMGGSLNWSTGLKEPLPTKTCLGIGLIDQDHNVSLELGAEKYSLKNDYPVQYKAGIEWWLYNIFALRCGFDQDLVPDDDASKIQTWNNFTSGLGLRVAGFQFDYAYRMTGSYGYKDNNSHFFSVSYIGRTDSVLSLEFTDLKDRQITADNAVSVAGSVSGKSLFLNGKEIKVREDGSFVCEIDLEPGVNTLDFVVRGAAGKRLTKKIMILREVKEVKNNEK